MYTELVLKAELKPGAPDDVWDVCWYLFGDGDRPIVTPEHDFFKCWRWTMIGNCSSYYHHPKAVSDMVPRREIGAGCIFSRSDLKNYEGEIELFLDWISPYLDTCGPTCIGWTWYEEAENPSLIWVGV